MGEHFGRETELVDMNEFPSWIVYEDGDFLALNKPGWLVCHPSKNGPLSSLAGAARTYLGSDSIHLVGRLDRETSGVVVLAKNKETASKAQKAMDSSGKGKKVLKTYLAILRGNLNATCTVSQPLAPDDKSVLSIKTACAARKLSAKSAVTTFVPVAHSRSEKYEPATLVEIGLITGRKHQIRAHAKWLGHQVVADKIYGDDETLYLDFVENGFTKEMGKILPMKRQALHAWRMDFSQIFEGKIFTAPLPEDFLEFMESREISLPDKYKKC